MYNVLVAVMYLNVNGSHRTIKVDDQDSNQVGIFYAYYKLILA